MESDLLKELDYNGIVDYFAIGYHLFFFFILETDNR